MTTYYSSQLYSNVLTRTVAFDPATDVIVFDMGESALSTVISAYGPGTDIGVAVLMADIRTLTSANFIFADNSVIKIGDETQGAGADDGANTLSLSGDGRLLGLGGDDHLTGAGAHDVLEGGAGNDTIQGSGGRDIILGGQRKPRILQQRPRNPRLWERWGRHHRRGAWLGPCGA